MRTLVGSNYHDFIEKSLQGMSFLLRILLAAGEASEGGRKSSEKRWGLLGGVSIEIMSSHLIFYDYIDIFRFISAIREGEVKLSFSQKIFRKSLFALKITITIK